MIAEIAAGRGQRAGQVDAGGRGLIRTTIDAIEALDITTAERELIFGGNAQALLKLPAQTKAKTTAIG